jgi:hypothetical protein
MVAVPSHTQTTVRLVAVAVVVAPMAAAAAAVIAAAAAVNTWRAVDRAVAVAVARTIQEQARPIQMDINQALVKL